VDTDPIAAIVRTPTGVSFVVGLPENFQVAGVKGAVTSVSNLFNFASVKMKLHEMKICSFPIDQNHVFSK